MSAPELSTEERATVERFDAAPAAEESFDAAAALRRVVALADFHAECCEYVKVRDLRAAVAGQ